MIAIPDSTNKASRFRLPGRGDPHLAAVLELRRRIEHHRLARRQPGQHLAVVAAGAAELQRAALDRALFAVAVRSEEHTSELQSLMRNSYAVFCLKKKKK